MAASVKLTKSLAIFYYYLRKTVVNMLHTLGVGRRQRSFTMAFTIFVALLALTHLVRAENLQIDMAQEPEDGKAINELIEFYTKFSAMEASLKDQPDKKDECDQMKKNYIDALPKYLESKQKTVSDCDGITVPSLKYPLPILTGEAECKYTATEQSVYSLSLNTVMGVMANLRSKATAIANDPNLLIQEMEKDPRLKTTVDTINKLQQRDDYKNAQNGLKQVIDKSNSIATKAASILQNVLDSKGKIPNFMVEGKGGDTTKAAATTAETAAPAAETAAEPAAEAPAPAEAPPA